ncbi:hypothetical protein COP1_005902 [Malus domestica]
MEEEGGRDGGGGAGGGGEDDGPEKGDEGEEGVRDGKVKEDGIAEDGVAGCNGEEGEEEERLENGNLLSSKRTCREM